MMRDRDGRDALVGTTHEVIMSNHVVLRMYASLDDEARGRVRHMLEKTYVGSTDVTGDMKHMPGVVSAEIKVSDSVATAVVEFEGGVLLRDSRVVMPGRLPETMRQGLGRCLITDVIAHPLLADFRCHGVEEGDDKTTLRFDWGVVYMHEPPRPQKLERWCA